MTRPVSTAGGSNHHPLPSPYCSPRLVYGHSAVPKGTHKLGWFERSMRTYEAFAANDRGIGHDFWLFHGINYLSDNPFPIIYRKGYVYRGKIFTHIMDAHLDGTGALSERGRQCLVWASTLPRELYRAVVYVKGFAHKYKRNPLLPDDPYVEAGMLAVAEVMETATRGWGQTEPPEPRDYYRDPVNYDREMRRVRRALLECDPRTRAGWDFWAERHRETISRYGLPAGVKPFRLDYRERRDRGYLVGQGRLEDRPKKGQ
jgi:hypothetical protein